MHAETRPSAPVQVGTNLLEFGALGLRSGRVEFLAAAEGTMRALHRANPGQGLLPRLIDRHSGAAVRGQLKAVGAGADSYYEYLLKYWQLAGKQVGQVAQYPAVSMQQCHQGCHTNPLCPPRAQLDAA